MMLAQAPIDPVDQRGMPLFGRYAGLARSFGWERLVPPFARGALWRRFHHKRWHFVALVTDELFCGMAVVDIGWGNSVLAYAIDRKRRELVGAFSTVGVAGLSAQVGDHARAPCRFRWPGVAMDIVPRGDDAFELRYEARKLRVHAEYGGRAPCLLAVGEADGGSVHSTQKSGALQVTGFVEVGGRRYQLDGGIASFDYSNGLVGRDTGWRWVSAQRPGLGVNLQAGYFGGSENALWLGGSIIPLGAAQFDLHDNVPESPWRIVTTDGLVDLIFTPEAARRDDTQMLVASSRLLQQVGVFEGWVSEGPDAPRRRVDGLVGVAEQHHARW